LQDKLPISIIIPTLNEANHLADLLSDLKQLPLVEIIVVDAKSKDETIAIAKKHELKPFSSEKAGRSIQMNMGAKEAVGEYLLFLHADVRLPFDFEDYLAAFISSPMDSANFRLQFDLPHWFLQFHAFFTRFTFLPFQFGDQGLLVKKTVFEHLGGFNEQMKILEDQEFLKRIRREHTFKKLSCTLKVSARAYRKHGVIRLQGIYYLLYLLYFFGLDIERLYRIYKYFLKGKSKQS